MPQKIFEPGTQAHWPIIEAYKSGRVSLRQTEAQLKDMGMVEWEVRLYLDNDDGDFE